MRTIFAVVLFSLGTTMAYADVQLLNMAGKPSDPSSCRKVRIDYVSYNGPLKEVQVHISDLKTGKTLRPLCDVVRFSGDDVSAGMALQAAAGQWLFFDGYELNEPYKVIGISTGR